MDFHWYPGNMAKAKKMMEENIKLVDLVIELLDARIPYSSRNPDIDGLAGHKERLLLLNKCDLANDADSDEWVRYFKRKGFPCAKVDSIKGKGLTLALDLMEEIYRKKQERDSKRGIRNRPVRAMVAGIPNVGKSTFINKMAGKSSAKTGDVPGLTRQEQWIRLSPNLELLDTPGILWPKRRDVGVGLKLALTGSIKGQARDDEELCLKFLEIFLSDRPKMLEETYGVEESDGPFVCLERIAKKRGFLAKGNAPDLEKAARLILKDFRKGRLGKITLEKPL